MERLAEKAELHPVYVGKIERGRGGVGGCQRAGKAEGEEQRKQQGKLKGEAWQVNAWHESSR